MSLSDAEINFPHQVLATGDLRIEDPLELYSGNLTCTATNIHGRALVTHTLTVHGEIIGNFIINFVSLLLSSL